MDRMKTGPRCLPTVESCCFCVRDFKLAVVFIGLYSFFIGSASSSYFLTDPICTNLDREDGAGLVELITCIILFMINVVYIVGAVLLVFKILANCGITAVYVYGCLMRAPVAVLYLIIVIITAYTTLKGDCKTMPIIENNFSSSVVPLSFALFAEILQGLIDVYFAIVCNSYDRKILQEMEEMELKKAASLQNENIPEQKSRKFFQNMKFLKKTSSPQL